MLTTEGFYFYFNSILRHIFILLHIKRQWIYLFICLFIYIFVTNLLTPRYVLWFAIHGKRFDTIQFSKRESCKTVDCALINIKTKKLTENWPCSDPENWPTSDVKKQRKLWCNPLKSWNPLWHFMAHYLSVSWKYTLW